MDRVSQIRCKHVLDKLLDFCDAASSEEEKATLLRIGVVVLNKLRLHSSEAFLGEDVRNLNKQIVACSGRAQLVDFMWEETVNLLEEQRTAFT